MSQFLNEPNEPVLTPILYLFDNVAHFGSLGSLRLNEQLMCLFDKYKRRPQYPMLHLYGGYIPRGNTPK